MNEMEWNSDSHGGQLKSSASKRRSYKSQVNTASRGNGLSSTDLRALSGESEANRISIIRGADNYELHYLTRQPEASRQDSGESRCKAKASNGSGGDVRRQSAQLGRSNSSGNSNLSSNSNSVSPARAEPDGMQPRDCPETLGETSIDPKVPSGNQNEEPPTEAHATSSNGNPSSGNPQLAASTKTMRARDWSYADDGIR